MEEDGRLIARPRGRLEASAGDHFAVAVQERLQPATRAVTIDLAELDFVGLAAIRSILRLARSLRAEDRALNFEHGGEAVREALRQAGFNDLFAFTPPLHSHGGHQHETS